MATLLLSGLGSAVGGQFGGLVGAMLGRSIDRSLSGSGMRRIKEDLSVQTAAFGREIPAIYGRMRVGGAIVWATDLKVQASSTSGKFGPDPTRYWANFAVAISSRKARNVRRIWADGKLIRGVAGDFKVPTKFRFYPGDEDQAIDPLIASVEGPEATLAFRGTALAVFEELQLTEFGNRIPFLTFEVDADEDEPTLGTIIEDLSGERLSARASNPAIEGFAAFGDNALTALGDLLEAFGTEDFGAEGQDAGGNVPATIDSIEMGCSSDERVGVQNIQRQSAERLPTEVRLGYFDSDLEYQSSEQKVSWATKPGPALRMDVPAALTADQAKRYAKDVLNRRWGARERITLHLPPHYLHLKPGDQVAIPGFGLLVVEHVEIDGLAVAIRCTTKPQESSVVPVSRGRYLPSIDVLMPASQVALLDLPAMDEAATVPKLTIAARGGASPWRSLPVSLAAEGRDGNPVTIERRSIMGSARDILAAGTTELIDRANSVLVELTDDDWLLNCTDEDLLNGANLALLGNELIQFGIAEPQGDRRFLIRRLMRGRFGSEWATGQHIVGDRFLLLAPERTSVQVPTDRIGLTFTASGHGIGDVETPSEDMLLFRAEALRPPCPVHLTATATVSGTKLTWKRRSRCGYHWLDLLDAPLAEEQERYRLTLRGIAAVKEVIVTEPRYDLSTAEHVALGEGPLTIDVVQLGSGLPSRAATIQIGN